MPDSLGTDIRGKARESAIDSYVDKTSTGSTPANAPSPPTVSGDKVHPGLRESAPYKPSQTERATHQYGAPISQPIVGQGK